MGEKCNPHTDEVHKPLICHRRQKIKIILFVATCKWRRIGNLNTKRAKEVVTWNLKFSARSGGKNEIIEKRQWGNILVPEMVVLILGKSVNRNVSVGVAIIFFLRISPLLLLYTQHVPPSPSQIVVSDFKSSSSPVRFALNISPIQISLVIFTASSLIQALFFSCLKNYNSLLLAPPAYILTPKSLFSVWQKSLKLDLIMPLFSTFPCLPHTSQWHLTFVFESTRPCMICPPHLFYDSLFSPNYSHIAFFLFLEALSLFLPWSLCPGCFLCPEWFSSRSHMADSFYLFISWLRFYPPRPGFPGLPKMKKALFPGTCSHNHAFLSVYHLSLSEIFSFI